jgi:hypothetical protein
MPNKPRRKVKSVKLVEQDVVRVEFLIDDLIKKLTKDPVSPVANCNGCGRCSAVEDLPGLIKER